MRVLLASDFYPPQVGGMEQHVQSLARRLRKLGHDVMVVTTSSHDAREVLDDIEVVRARGSAQRLTFAFASDERRYPPPVIDPELTHKIGRAIDRFRPDVIHAHGWIAYSVLAANLRRRLPVVITLHDYGHFCIKRTLLRDDRECEAGRGLHCLSCAKKEYGWAKAITCYAGTEVGLRQLRGADAFIAVSDYVRQQSEPFLGGRPIQVLPNFLDPEELASERDRTARAELPDRFLLFVGVLAPFKGVDDAIAAFRTLKSESSDFSDLHLLLLGPEHPDHHYADDAELGLKVMTRQRRGLVVEAVASSACTLIPSRCPETASRVAIESVCAGRPIVAARKGGIPEMLRGAPMARIVAPNQPRQIADAAAALLRDTDSLDTLGRWGGPRDYLPLQPDRVTRLILDVYQTAVEQRREALVREYA